MHRPTFHWNSTLWLSSSPEEKFVAQNLVDAEFFFVENLLDVIDAAYKWGGQRWSSHPTDIDQVIQIQMAVWNQMPAIWNPQLFLWLFAVNHTKSYKRIFRANEAERNDFLARRSQMRASFAFSTGRFIISAKAEHACTYGVGLISLTAENFIPRG